MDLPKPNWYVERRLYIDAFWLDKNWGEARLYSELSCMFEKICELDPYLWTSISSYL